MQKKRKTGRDKAILEPLPDLRQDAYLVARPTDVFSLDCLSGTQ